MWMSLIVISGIVFMHKEVTSDGQFITHVHPYDFTKKKNGSHHKSDAEIRYLDIVFQGSFTEPIFYNFSAPVRITYDLIQHFYYVDTYCSFKTHHLLNRGPPAVV